MRYTTRSYSIGRTHGGRLPPGVKWLLITNIGLFLIYFFAVRAEFGAIFQLLSLWPRAVLQVVGIPQLFTYMFIHDPWGFTHILFNMFALWMFGSDLERTWGTRRFLQYYFFCGVGAGICAVVGNVLFGALDSRTIGASGAIYGLLLAFGVLFPDSTILFSFLFPIKAKYFVLIIGVITFLSTMNGVNSGVSHVAHLGGMVFGYVFLKFGMYKLDFFDVLARDYREWKIRRARRKFQIYMRKHDNGPDHTIH